MADHIPDAISNDALAELLKSRTHLPEVAFHRDHPSEMGFLIALLVHRSANRGPTKAHLLHALMCLLVTLQHHLSEDAAQAAAKIRSPMDAVFPIFLSQLVGITKQMEGLGESLLDAFQHQHNVAFDGSVSDAFLQSVGVSRSDYEELRAKGSKP